MNTSVDLTLSLAADGSALPSLFFRPADRLRLEGCIAALTQEGRSLALSSPHDAALDHYGRLLTERLRRALPQTQVETYFPASTDALVSRFNEFLAGQTMREAMSEAPSQPPGRIWVVHDAGALAEHELQLLARLVNNFPGAQIRVVLLLGPGVRSRKAFEALGRRFVRWDIEAPTPEQALAMLEQARTDGCESLVRQLLRHVQPVAEQAPASTPVEPLNFKPAPPVAAPARPPVAGVAGRLAELLQRLRAQPWLEKLRRGRIAWPRRSSFSLPARKGLRLPKARWVMAVVGLAALSVAVSAWLHGGRFGAAKPAAQQPVKDLRSSSGANLPALGLPHDQPAGATRESRT